MSMVRIHLMSFHRERILIAHPGAQPAWREALTVIVIAHTVGHYVGQNGASRLTFRSAALRVKMMTRAISLLTAAQQQGARWAIGPLGLKGI